MLQPARHSFLARLRPSQCLCQSQCVQSSIRMFAAHSVQEQKAGREGSESEWEGEPGQQQPAEDPPGVLATVGLMGFGAIGALGIMAVGVTAVLAMANVVASGTGRSIMASKSDLQSGQEEAEKKLHSSTQ